MTSTNKKSLHLLHQKANPCTVACFLSLFTAHQTTSFPNSQQEELARHQINTHIHVILHAHQTNLLISSPLQLSFNPLPHQRLLVDFRLLLFTFDLCSPHIHPQFSNTTPHRSKCRYHFSSFPLYSPSRTSTSKTHPLITHECLRPCPLHPVLASCPVQQTLPLLP